MLELALQLFEPLVDARMAWIDLLDPPPEDVGHVVVTVGPENPAELPQALRVVGVFLNAGTEARECRDGLLVCVRRLGVGRHALRVQLVRAS